MIRSYIKIGWRSLVSSKLHSVISITGLALGLAFAIAIALFVQHEYSVERFDGSEKVYRANVYLKDGEKVSMLASSAAALAPALVAEVPGILSAVRFRECDPMLFQYEDNRFYEAHILYADSSLFNVFPFKLKAGNAATALVEPFTAVLTQKTAEKYFGRESALGKTLILDNAHPVRVTGVLAPYEVPSHLDADLFLSFPTFKALRPEIHLEDWGWVSFFTYFRLDENTDVADVEGRIPALVEKNMRPGSSGRISYHFQRIQDIYLHSDGLQGFIGPLGNRSHVYTLSVIGALILLISSFNFTNLAIARAGGRSREIGLRKVLGSDRKQLIGQFLSESMMVALLSFAVAMGLLEVLGPALGSWINIELATTAAIRAQMGLAFLLVTLVVGIGAGLYPAVFMSGFKTVSILKGHFKTGRAGSGLRKSLVTIQFAVSGILMIGTGVVVEQMDFTRSKDLGFDREQVIVLPMRGPQLMQKYAALKEALLREPSVVSVASARNGLDGDYGSFGIVPEGGNPEEPVRLLLYPVNYDFFETLGMTMLEGRSFSKSYPTDELEGIILNESAVKRLGWTSPLGQRLDLPHIPGAQGAVVGVVKDFHFTSLHDEIGPLMMFMMPERNDNVFVRLRKGTMSENVKAVEAVWRQIVPAYPFDFVFLDQRLQRIYLRDEQFARVTTVFSTAAIGIACMGLFGLAAFAAHQKTKEIGIRKVLGASVANLLALVSGEFISLVVLSNVLAWPLAYIAVQEWLKDFAYRIDLNWVPFALAAAVTLGIAMLTVVSQAYRASTANPAEVLKHE